MYPCTCMYRCILCMYVHSKYCMCTHVHEYTHDCVDCGMHIRNLFTDTERDLTGVKGDVLIRVIKVYSVVLCNGISA